MLSLRILFLVSAHFIAVAIARSAADSARSMVRARREAVTTLTSLTYGDGSAVLGDTGGTRLATTMGSRQELTNEMTSVRLQLLSKSDGSAQNFKLDLAPSIFAAGAKIHRGSETVDAASYEPPTYTSDQASITITSGGYVSGVVVDSAGDWWQVSTDVHGALSASDMSDHVHDGTNRSGGHPFTSHAAHGDDRMHTHTRERRAAEPWFGGGACYEDDDVTRAVPMGFAVTGRLATNQYQNDLAQITAAVASWVASTNVPYNMQLNLVLQVGEIYVSQGNEIWDNTGCTKFWDSTGSEPDIAKSLNQFQSWSKPSRYALWHLFEDCLPVGGGTLGHASVGTLCTEDQNSGITYYNHNEPDKTWETFAHGVGHNLGGKDSAEDGKGKTGGIMDDGGGYYNDVVQFNTKYRNSEMCTLLNGALKAHGTCDKTAPLVTPFVAGCGNGIVEAGEECECADGRTSCLYCNDCQLQPDKQCTPEAHYIPGKECCDPSGMFKSFGTDCEAQGSAGWCAVGLCQVSSHQCTKATNLEFCGLGATMGDDTCLVKCGTRPNCTSASFPDNFVSGRTGVALNYHHAVDGSSCVDAAQNPSTCLSGVCQPVAASCGNGIVEFSNAENCECSGNSTSCSGCEQCQLVGAAECIAGTQCCESDGTYTVFGTACSDETRWGEPGHCARGVCAQADNCVRYRDDPNLAFYKPPGTWTGGGCRPTNGGCKMFCGQTNGKCSWSGAVLRDGVAEDRVADGSYCTDAKGDWSTCFNGQCIESICDAAARSSCAAANKLACEPSSPGCGGCVVGHVPDGDACVPARAPCSGECPKMRGKRVRVRVCVQASD